MATVPVLPESGARHTARHTAGRYTFLDAGVLAIREPGSPDDASMLLASEVGWPRVVTVGRFLSPCWETWAAHGLGLHAAASGDLSAALHHLADAVTRSRPTRGGHLWSYVWAMTDAARLGRRLGDPRHVTWQEEALATALRCGMRALAGQLRPDADST
jgi:hypothetical protein